MARVLSQLLASAFTRTSGMLALRAATIVLALSLAALVVSVSDSPRSADAGNHHICVLNVTPAQSALDPAGIEQFETRGVFKIVTLDGMEVKVVSPVNLADPCTVIGRSASFTTSTEPLLATIPGGGSPQHPQTAAQVARPCLRPVDFIGGTLGPDQAGSRTEILHLNLKEGALEIRAGQDFTSSALFRNSIGEIASRSATGTGPPWYSYFNVFFEAQTPGGTFYNQTPLVVRNMSINQLPPGLGLQEMELYIHDPSFPGAALFDEMDRHRGYLLSSGHSDKEINMPVAEDAKLLVELDRPVSFTVDSTSEGTTGTTPNEVSSDKGQAVQQVTVYQSSGTSGQGPNNTNVRVDELIGTFPAGTVISGISWGRDGTLDSLRQSTLGTLYFTVNRSSGGQPCSAVHLNRFDEAGAEFDPPKQAPAVYASGVGPFGAETDTSVRRPPVSDTNMLALGGSAIGLRPELPDSAQDETTSLEISAYKAGDTLYVTLSGTDFVNLGGDTATIYSLSPGASFEFSNLQVFRTPTALGLQAGDSINSLIVSESDGTVAFTLAPGSPSLAGGSPADVQQSSGGGSFSLFASHVALDLLASDVVDGLDIRPSLPPPEPITEPTPEPTPTPAMIPPTGGSPAAGSDSFPILVPAAAIGLALIGAAWYAWRRWNRRPATS